MAECDYDSEVWLQFAHGCDERFVFQFLGLENRSDAEFAGGDFHVAFLQFQSATRRFVGRRYDGDDVISALDKCFERRYGEFGRTHEYYA